MATRSALYGYQVCSGQAWATADVLYAVQAEELEKRLGYTPNPHPTLPLTQTLDPAPKPYL